MLNKEVKPNVFARIDENGRNLYFAAGNKVFDTNGKIVAANAMEVAKIICRADKSTAPDPQQENQRAARFLVKHFGEERAEAAVLFAHRDNHREDIKNYNLALEKTTYEKRQESIQQLRDNDKNKDWSRSR